MHSDYRRYAEWYHRELQKGADSQLTKADAPGKPIYTVDDRGKVRVSNIYNKGWVQNLWELVYPRSSRPDVAAISAAHAGVTVVGDGGAAAAPSQQQKNSNKRKKK